MKECEVYSALKVPCTSKIVIRIDGRNFHQLSQELNFEKPYDNNFAHIMAITSSNLFQEFSSSFSYTFSDEINILLKEIPFGGRIEKLDSVIASYASGSFTKNLLIKLDLDINELNPISFDSRIIPLSPSYLTKYFQGRQSEAWRNCMNSYAYWTLREEHSKENATKLLKSRKSSEIHELLYDHGVNLSKVPSWQRRGIGIYREKKLIEGYNPKKEEKVQSIRKKVFKDWNLPIFDENFFKKILSDY